MRTGGAEALAFDVACLSGPEAALPHGAPGDRPVLDRSVLLFDFGAQVDGYRSDMTRTLFVGEPTDRDLAVYELVAGAQAAAINAVEEAVRGGGELPSGRAVDAIARAMIDDDGRGATTGTALGTGSTSRRTRARPRQGRRGDAAPEPTVFSVEPGIYLEARWACGSRTSSPSMRRGRVERLTRIPERGHGGRRRLTAPTSLSCYSLRRGPWGATCGSRLRARAVRVERDEPIQSIPPGGASRRDVPGIRQALVRDGHGRTVVAAGIDRDRDARPVGSGERRRSADRDPSSAACRWRPPRSSADGLVTPGTRPRRPVGGAATVLETLTSNPRLV